MMDWTPHINQILSLWYSSCATIIIRECFMAVVTPSRQSPSRIGAFATRGPAWGMCPPPQFSVPRCPHKKSCLMWNQMDKGSCVPPPPPYLRKKQGAPGKSYQCHWSRKSHVRFFFWKLSGAWLAHGCYGGQYFPLLFATMALRGSYGTDLCEGGTGALAIQVYRQLRARSALLHLKDVPLRTEGCYRHRVCTAIAPFWFSTEHLWNSITPFWLSTDDMW